MSQDERDSSPPSPPTLTRRELLGVLGATAAASLVGSSPTLLHAGDVAGEQTNVFRVVALGDSAMWGQGLDDGQKYYRLAGERIARGLGKTPTFRNGARSGAMIAEPKVRDHRAGLPPSGRAGFVDQYPALFPDKDARDRFMAGNGAAAYRLYRDLPATYPTITQQVDLVDDALAGSADLLLLNGGINDLDKELVLSPDGYSLEEMERAVEFAFYTKVKELLGAARRKFPRAVIIVPAYFPVLSDKSAIHELKKFLEFVAEHLKFTESWLVASNHFLNTMTGWLPGSALLQDVEKTARLMVQRTKFAYGRGLYYQRKAVAEAHTDPGVRGPGIFFAHPRFSIGNALYADETPMFWEGYQTPPRARLPQQVERLVSATTVKDPQRDDRLRECPRLNHVDVIRAAAAACATGLQVTAPYPQIRRALAVLDGPTSLRQTLTKLTTTPSRTLYSDGLDALRAEEGRIAVARFASFLHPNPAGADRYAEAITRTYNESRDTRLESHLRQLEPNAQRRANVGEVLRRYGLDPTVPPEVTWQYMVVDCIGLSIETLSHSATGLVFGKAWLRTQRGEEWRLWNSYMHQSMAMPRAGLPQGRTLAPELRPGNTALFTFDPASYLHLGELRRIQLRYEGKSDSVWKVGGVDLFINGKRVFRRTAPLTLRDGESVALGYVG